ncbi:hypothetical protein L3Q82_004839 [Scortum barcoo]|uniref:Uncharacterized protein n=1 Tax=Scortum barcoo TaxID=214431 RepID=A0ACB8VES2_9TELE|nr:hypothetical protein L3Q82_004839 [Scortum barcoo]
MYLSFAINISKFIFKQQRYKESIFKGFEAEVEQLEGWCRQNNLCINVKKTKEMIVDFRRGRHLPSPLYIGGTAVEVVSSFSCGSITKTKSSIERLSERGLDSVEESHGFRDAVEGQNTCSVIQVHSDSGGPRT